MVRVGSRCLTRRTSRDIILPNLWLMKVMSDRFAPIGLSTIGYGLVMLRGIFIVVLILRRLLAIGGPCLG